MIHTHPPLHTLMWLESIVTLESNISKCSHDQCMHPTCKWTRFPMIICRMVLPITFVRKWRKEEEPARVFIAPQGINSSVPAPISLSEGEEASYGSFAISAPAECCNLSHCHDATTLALDGPLQFTVWLFSPHGCKVSHRI